MEHRPRPPRTGDDAGRRSAEANAWESRLLALNALVDLAREHATGRAVSGDRGYRLEHALNKVRQAVDVPRRQHRETVQAAVREFGDALESLSGQAGQKR